MQNTPHITILVENMVNGQRVSTYRELSYEAWVTSKLPMRLIAQEINNMLKEVMT